MNWDSAASLNDRAAASKCGAAPANAGDLRSLRLSGDSNAFSGGGKRKSRDPAVLVKATANERLMQIVVDGRESGSYAISINLRRFMCMMAPAARLPGSNPREVMRIVPCGNGGKR